jgi:uncharacterized repeat protein (TIGR03803 family)
MEERMPLMRRLQCPRPRTYWTHSNTFAFTLAILWAISAVSAEAQTFTLLYSFPGGTQAGPHGGLPRAGVIRDSAGNLYGTTEAGGAFGFGTVFKLTPTSKESVLYSFTGGTDGDGPIGGVIRDASGNLYGATSAGGDLSCNSGTGCGTVFRVDSTGKETVLFSFPGGNAGEFPSGDLTRDNSGNLYGATQTGGSLNGGVIFKLDRNNNETILYNFTGANGGPDGANPNGGLVRDGAGNLYGTTSYGGTFKGFGTVFKLDLAGNETTLYSFSGGSDGGNPSAGVIRDSAGNLYGTTQLWGAYCCGVAFKLDTTGNETVLHAFGSGLDGGSPNGPLIRDGAGTLYGVTERGGEYGWGTVYKVDSTGNETILRSFTGGRDGLYPIGSLNRDSKGRLYGVTNQGGTYAWGNIFRLTL